MLICIHYIHGGDIGYATPNTRDAATLLSVTYTAIEIVADTSKTLSVPYL